MHSARPSPASKVASAPSAAVDPRAVREAAARSGVTLHDGPYGTQTRVDAGAPAAASLAAGALAWLAGLSVLRVTGDDASRFLHSQTTNDLLQQPADTARWHGYCSPKGRLLATMLVWRDGEAIRLLLPDGVAEPTRARLAMFVLRSKVRIADESGAYAVFGLIGAAAHEALDRLGLRAPAPMQVVAAAAPAANAERGASADAGATGGERSPLTVVGLPALPAQALHGATAPVPRWLLVVPVESAATAWDTLRASLVPVGSATWRWTDVRTGIATIVPSTREQFVPQMLNFEADAIGAVSFTKGCYPGQEVVARSHYLGKTKRRTFLGRLAAPAEGEVREPAPGDDVTDASGAAVGRVVSAAPSPEGAIDLLFEAQVAAVEDGALAVDGQALQTLELPYPLPPG